MKYQDKYNLEISKDKKFENKYKDMRHPRLEM